MLTVAESSRSVLNETLKIQSFPRARDGPLATQWTKPWDLTEEDGNRDFVFLAFSAIRVH